MKARKMTEIRYNETNIWIALEESLACSLSKEWDHAIKEFKKLHKKNEYGYYEMTFVDFIRHWGGFIVGNLILPIDQHIFIPYEMPYEIHTDKPPKPTMENVEQLSRDITNGITNVENSKKEL